MMIVFGRVTSFVLGLGFLPHGPQDPLRLLLHSLGLGRQLRPDRQIQRGPGPQLVAIHRRQFTCDSPGRGRGEVEVSDLLGLGVELVVAVFGGFAGEGARHGVGRQVVPHARSGVLLVVTEIHASVWLLHGQIDKQESIPVRCQLPACRPYVLHNEQV